MNNYYTLTLDSAQMQSGVYQGQQRHEYSKFHRNTRGTKPEESLFKHTEGSLGEVAFYLAFQELLDTFKISVNQQGKPDFYIKGKPIDVKTSTWPNLLVNVEQLKPDWLYPTMQKLRRGNYRVIGYMRGSEIERHPEWIRNPNNDGPCFIVPKDDLHAFRKFSANKVDKKTWPQDNRYEEHEQTKDATSASKLYGRGC